MSKSAIWRIPVFRIKQHNVIFFIGYAQAQELLKVKVDVYHPIGNPQGYQRILDKYRAKRFMRYIRYSKHISPPAITLSVRGPFEFEGKDQDTHYGILKIPQRSKVYVVDGQHRKEGLSMAIKENA